MTNVTTIADESLEVGTRVHWDDLTQSLYFVDVPLSLIYRYKPSTNILTKARVETDPLAFAFPVTESDDKFIGALGRRFVTFEWDGTSDNVTNWTTIGEVDTETDLIGNRLNGGKIDPYGRLWAGSMGPTDSQGQTIPGKGSLYSVSKGEIKKHISGIGISNGLAFDVHLKKMYYIDTLFPGVYQFDYDGIKGEIKNQKIIFKFADHSISGLPDGLTIDRNGNLWVAVIYGSAIVKFDPRTGELLQTIKMPTPEITALTWGDRECDVLYVTSAKMPIDGKVPEAPAGCTFKVTNLGFEGAPGDRYQI